MQSFRWFNGTSIHFVKLITEKKIEKKSDLLMTDNVRPIKSNPSRVVIYLSLGYGMILICSAARVTFANQKYVYDKKYQLFNCHVFGVNRCCYAFLGLPSLHSFDHTFLLYVIRAILL